MKIFLFQLSFRSNHGPSGIYLKPFADWSPVVFVQNHQNSAPCPARKSLLWRFLWFCIDFVFPHIDLPLLFCTPPQVKDFAVNSIRLLIPNGWRACGYEQTCHWILLPINPKRRKNWKLHRFWQCSFSLPLQTCQKGVCWNHQTNVTTSLQVLHTYVQLFCFFADHNQRARSHNNACQQLLKSKKTSRYGCLVVQIWLCVVLISKSKDSCWSSVNSPHWLQLLYETLKIEFSPTLCWYGQTS